MRMVTEPYQKNICIDYLAPMTLLRVAVLVASLRGACANLNAEACPADADCGGQSLEKSTNFLQVSLDLQAKRKSQTGYGKAKADAEYALSKKGREERGQRIKAMIASAPSFCSSSNSNGFAKVLDDDYGSSSESPAGVAQVILIDWTDAFEKQGSVAVSIQAMSKYGTYQEFLGYKTVMGYAAEIVYDNMFTFRPSADRQFVDMFRATMDIRTSDPQSEQALKDGLGSGWIDSLSRFPCTDETGKERWIMDATPLIYNGFYVADTDGLPQRLYASKSFKHNLDVTVDYADEEEFRTSHTGAYAATLEFSITMLPEVPMKTRAGDERLLFFDIEYTDQGMHELIAPQKPANVVDVPVSRIWRWNIEKKDDDGNLAQIKFYVDPTVPVRWHEFFRKGIEAWNDAFDLLGTGRQIVKGFCPGDADWPEDYDRADSRFSVILWSLSPETTSMGQAKVDPRSGEIIKGDIVMADTWVKAFLYEFELTNLDLTQTMSLLGTNSNRSSLKLEKRGSSLHERDKDKALNFMSHLVRRRHKMTNDELEALIGAGLQDVVMHEVGHTLGLRHNFKGTMDISPECLQDMSCTGKYGLTTSVMDYVPLNLPKDGSPYETHIFTPVIGEYDKLAILYGYMNFSSDEKDPEVRASLDAVLEKAESSFQTCYDDDQSASDDPTCLAYDISSDPVQYFEDQVYWYASLQKDLLERAVEEKGTYEEYGKAVLSTYALSLSAVIDLASYIGGINNTYLRNDAVGRKPGNFARKPLPVNMQRRALSMLVKAMRPTELGLLPATDALPYDIDGDAAYGYIYSVDNENLYLSFCEEVLGALFSTVAQVCKQEHLLSGVKNAPEALTLNEMMRSMIAAASVDYRTDVLSASEKALQISFAKKLVALSRTELHAEAAEEVNFQLLYVTEAAKAAYEKAGLSSKDPAWTTCAVDGESCSCVGLVRYGSHINGFSTMGHSTASIGCRAEEFADVLEIDKRQSTCQCLASGSTPRELNKIHFAKLYMTLRS